MKKYSHSRLEKLALFQESFLKLKHSFENRCFLLFARVFGVRVILTLQKGLYQNLGRPGMFLLLLLSILVVQVLNITLNEDYFVSYVKQYPVKSISPCEDFFAHACSAVPEEDLSSAFKRKQIEAMFNPEDYVNEKAAKLSVFLKVSDN